MNKLFHLVAAMARHPMAVFNLVQVRFFHAAAVDDKRAAGMETAPGRRVQWTGHIALQNDAAASPGGFRDGNAG